MCIRAPGTPSPTKSTRSAPTTRRPRPRRSGAPPRSCTRSLADDAVSRYLELGLRLGRLLDGFIDAYYGPAELKQRVDNEPTPDPAGLTADARRLLADLDAGDGDLDAHRRRWIHGQVRG